MIDFLKTRGSSIHGHPIVWGNNTWQRPTWIWDDFCPEPEKFAQVLDHGLQIPDSSHR